MQQPSEASLDKVRQHTVAVVLGMRAEFLSAGANPLKHWDQILDRMRAATRMSTSVQEWTTAVARGLQLGSGSSLRNTDQIKLAETVEANGGARFWLDMLEREYGYIIALARVAADGKRLRKQDADKELLK